MAATEENLAERIAALHKDLSSKRTLVAACQGLASLCETPALTADARQALVEAGKRAFQVLRTRFSSPKFWQAGLELFLAVEFHLPDAAEIAGTWRDAAMEEVDEETRERTQQQKQLNQIKEDRTHCQGRFNDANTPVTMEQLMAAVGVISVEDDGKLAMSRDAQEELRIVTVMKEDTCVICQEILPVSSKAKSMPCGHLFHDDCIVSWVQKSNSCPTCRFDELPSEKRHFDDVQRRVQSSAPSQSGVYT